MTHTIQKTLATIVLALTPMYFSGCSDTKTQESRKIEQTDYTQQIYSQNTSVEEVLKKLLEARKRYPEGMPQGSVFIYQYSPDSNPDQVVILKSVADQLYSDNTRSYTFSFGEARRAQQNGNQNPAVPAPGNGSGSGSAPATSSVPASQTQTPTSVPAPQEKYNYETYMKQYCRGNLIQVFERMLCDPSAPHIKAEFIDREQMDRKYRDEYGTIYRMSRAISGQFTFYISPRDPKGYMEQTDCSIENFMRRK